MDAELMLDRRARNIIALRQRAVRADEEFGHQEQRDTARSFGRVGETSEHQVHDIFGHVVIAPGDENLLAGDAEVVTVGYRSRANRRQIRTCLRLGQVHRTRPLAAYELWQKPTLQLV